MTTIALFPIPAILRDTHVLSHFLMRPQLLIRPNPSPPGGTSPRIPWLSGNLHAGAHDQGQRAQAEPQIRLPLLGLFKERGSMWLTMAGIIRVPRIIVLWCVLFYCIPGVLFGSESERTPPGPSQPQASFTLTVTRVCSRFGQQRRR